MEIREFAESILYRSSLSDKLDSVSAFTDKNPTSSRPEPDFPERSTRLSFKDRNFQSQKFFPGKAKLSNPTARAHVLHFFANHELLAMEIMALTLLRFPDAPSSFRQGVAQTIREEQEHLTLYIERMRELGVDFGDIPVNGYFWSVFKRMQSPKDFVAQMSLTFEQANLDYSRHYADEFKRNEDFVSAEILEKVLADEIGHVKHGLHWFNQWRSGENPLWEEFKAALPPPLSPARAKGIGFDVKSRRQAGIPDEFINELKIFSQSKSRPPVLYYFNPSFETNLTLEQWTPRPAESKSAVDTIQSDLSSLMAFIANQTDSVYVMQKPTSAHLLALQDFGFTSPEFIDANDLTHHSNTRKFDRIIPWGFCPEFIYFQNKLHSLNENYLQTTQQLSFPEYRRLSAKSFTTELTALFSKDTAWVKDLNRVLVSSTSQLLLELKDRFETQNISKVVLKSLSGSSGRSQIRILQSEWISKSENKKWLPWVERELGKLKHIVLENWLDRLVDLSMLGSISADMQAKRLGVTRPICDRRGQYLGHYLGRKFSNLPSIVLQYWHQKGESIADDAFRRVSEELIRQKFTGSFGIDMFLYEKNQILNLLPVVELNPRLTMGNIALELDRHIVPSQAGIFGIIPKASFQENGFKEYQDFLKKIRIQLEDQFFDRSGFRQIKSGFRFLTDPSQSTLVNSFLAVGENSEVVFGALNQLLPESNPFRDLDKK